MLKLGKPSSLDSSPKVSMWLEALSADVVSLKILNERAPQGTKHSIWFNDILWLMESGKFLACYHVTKWPEERNAFVLARVPGKPTLIYPPISVKSTKYFLFLGLTNRGLKRSSWKWNYPAIN